MSEEAQRQAQGFLPPIFVLTRAGIINWQVFSLKKTLIMGSLEHVQKYMNPQGAMSQLQ